MTRMLVTGGVGCIGSYTESSPARSGYLPIVLDNLSNGHRCAVKWGTPVGGDLEDPHLVREPLKRRRVEAVIHFAVDAAVTESRANPYKHLCHNSIRDGMRVTDLVDAYVKAIEYMSCGCLQHAWSGNPHRKPLSADAFLGWRARYLSLHEIVSTVWNWLASPLAAGGLRVIENL